MSGVFTEDQRGVLREAAVVDLEEANTQLVLKAVSALHAAKAECVAALEGLGTGRKATRDYAVYQAVVEALDKSLTSAERARKLLSRA